MISVYLLLDFVCTLRLCFTASRFDVVFRDIKVCASWKKMNTVQKYYKISEPPNFTLQSYVKPILTFRLS